MASYLAITTKSCFTGPPKSSYVLCQFRQLVRLFLFFFFFFGGGGGVSYTKKTPCILNWSFNSKPKTMDL